MKVLVAVDDSTCTKQMLDYLAAHTGLLGAAQPEYVVLTVALILPDHILRYLDHNAADDYYQSSANNVLAPVKVIFEEHELNARFISKVGHPAEVIARMAEAEEVDLVCMGTHGRSAWKTVLLGSVANEVLARVKVPLLLFH
ncbi:universal stress protein [Aquabacterium sp.]|uniref:universal stress protein n=1 Tax=Aquabacterium sp. TaxID=1872578 RepID=UPI003D6CAA61